MKYFLFFIGFIISLSGFGQQNLNARQVRLLNNSDSTAINATTGIIRYDPLTGKYRFYNALAGTWGSFVDQGGGQFWKTSGTTTLTGNVLIYTLGEYEVVFQYPTRFRVTTGAASTFAIDDPAAGDGIVMSSPTGVKFYVDGATTPVQGDVYQAGSDGYIDRLPSVATGNVLLSGGVSTANSWGKVTSSHVDATVLTDATGWKTTGTTTITTPTISGNPTFQGSFVNKGTTTLRNTANENKLIVSDISGISWTLGAIGWQANTGGISFSGNPPVNSAILFGSSGTIAASSSNAPLAYQSGVVDALSGTINGHTFNLGTGFVLASGTTSYNLMNLVPLLQTSGSYSGTVRGVYYNPTVNSSTGMTHIAFENTSGQLRFGAVTQDDSKTRVAMLDASTGQLFWRASSTLAGITNTATTNEITKSNGTNIVGTGLFSSTDGAWTRSGNFGLTTTGDATINTANGIGLHADHTGTNDVYNSLIVGRTTPSSPATGIGASISYLVETSSGNSELGVYLSAITTDATAASEDFDWVVSNMAGGTAPVETFRVKSTGAVLIPTSPTAASTGDVLGRNTSTGAIERRTDITSGTYTPTGAAVSNVSSVTTHIARYSRIGNQMSVSGAVSLSPTAATETIVSLTAPISSAFVDYHDAAGTASPDDPALCTQGKVISDGFDDLILLVFDANSTSPVEFFYTYMYTVK